MNRMHRIAALFIAFLFLGATAAHAEPKSKGLTLKGFPPSKFPIVSAPAYCCGQSIKVEVRNDWDKSTIVKLHGRMMEPYCKKWGPANCTPKDDLDLCPSETCVETAVSTTNHTAKSAGVVAPKKTVSISLPCKGFRGRLFIYATDNNNKGGSFNGSKFVEVGGMDCVHH